MGRRQQLLDNYATDNEIAAELDVHPRTVDRWCDEGALVWTRLGGRRLIDIKASRAALAARARGRRRTP